MDPGEEMAALIFTRLYPSHKVHDERDKEQHEKDVKQNLRDTRSRACNTAENVRSGDRLKRASNQKRALGAIIPKFRKTGAMRVAGFVAVVAKGASERAIPLPLLTTGRKFKISYPSLGAV
jgi:hypothetical protein